MIYSRVYSYLFGGKLGTFNFSIQKKWIEYVKLFLIILVLEEENQISPAQIRTGVKGSKGLYA